MKKISLLALGLLLLSNSFARAETLPLPLFLDPLGLFQNSAAGLLGDRTADGARYPYADKTRGGGKFLQAKSSYRGGGTNTKLLRD